MVTTHLRAIRTVPAVGTTRLTRSVACDCGHRDTANDLAALVVLAQAHARNCHGMELPADLIEVMAGPAATDNSGEKR